MHHTTGMPLLWLDLLWNTAFCMVGVSHTWHAVHGRGPQRWWHLVHTIMAAGMMFMYFPSAHSTSLNWIGATVFGLLGLVLLVLVAAWTVRESGIDPHWPMLLVEIVAMSYVFAQQGKEKSVLGILFGVYFGLQAIVWAFNFWSDVVLTRKNTTTKIKTSSRRVRVSLTRHGSRNGLHVVGHVTAAVHVVALRAPQSTYPAADCWRNVGFLLALVFRSVSAQSTTQT